MVDAFRATYDSPDRARYLRDKFVDMAVSLGTNGAITDNTGAWLNAMADRLDDAIGPRETVALERITIVSADRLPDGVHVVTVDCDGPSAFARLPRALMFDGREYGRTGWNSDRFVAYYRTDAKTAEAL